MLPDFVQDGLTAQGIIVRSVVPVAGGEISTTVRLEIDTGSLFLKYNSGPGISLFTAERIGLEALRRAGAIRIPEVVAEGSGSEGAFLALEYIPDAPPHDPTVFRNRFARELVALHRSGPEDGEGYGFPTDNFIGHFPQENRRRTARWADFYLNSRIFPQIERARTHPGLPNYRTTGLLFEPAHPLRRMLNDLCARIPELLDGMPEEPSLIHGDLWSGNFLCASGDEPILIDPAAYYGHREVEMAFIELFGGFPPGFVTAYEQEWPLDEGYVRRRSLHQLYPLLVHLNHFGERYAPAVERVCREYLD
jgi:fructosamine-3-kinase